MGIVSTVKAIWIELADASEISVCPLKGIIVEHDYQKAYLDGAQMAWATPASVKEMAKLGWKPLLRRGYDGQVSIFVDSNREAVALIK